MCCAGRALRGRGAAEDGLLARPDRPSRCTLPITALRVTFPSSAAIWLAESPASQSFFNCSTRSSDQVSIVIALFPLPCAGPARSAALRCQISKPLRTESLKPRQPSAARPDAHPQTPQLKPSPPHEMSYPTKEKLQYAVTHAQGLAKAVHMFRHQSFEETVVGGLTARGCAALAGLLPC